ncbi:sigma-70 family RNA polymerase sigma factor [Gordonia mangrovi]|nr:sigma-70 family RNA polymerase sigma factor [Gordonia mangrovi]UVF78157.1 sigma-70 family RNA polymerase sigma factor [Gordonia mangrovi]
MTDTPHPLDPHRVEEWWSRYHRLVWDVAYRIGGSVSDAEDVAQDTYLRFVEHRGDVTNPKGWLTTVAAHAALDRLRAHEHRRRAFVGQWLPEPLVVADDALPVEDRITLDDSVRMALLVVLERLTHAERTAFLLHDVFRLEFTTIADVLGTLAGLVAVLAPDVAGDFDSGGLIAGAPVGEVRGSTAIATQLLRSLSGRGLEFGVASVNVDPGAVIRHADRVVTVIAFTFGPDGIRVLHGIGNPDKLRHLNCR